MRSNPYIPLIAALIALLCIGIVVGTIAVGLIPVYLQQKGDDISVPTNSNPQVYALSYITNSKNPTSYSIEDMNALSAQLNQALNLKELVTTTAKYVPPTSSSSRKRRAATECAKGQNTKNGIFEMEFRIDYSKACRTQACQRKLADQVNSHITRLFPSINLSVNLPNGTSISFSLSFCSLKPAVSTSTTQQTSTTYTPNLSSSTTSTASTSITATSTTTAPTTATSTTTASITATSTTTASTTATSTTTASITATSTTTAPTTATSTTTASITATSTTTASITATSTTTASITATSTTTASTTATSTTTASITATSTTTAPTTATSTTTASITATSTTTASTSTSTITTAPSCKDGIKNNGESDVDCGGIQTPRCFRCRTNKACTQGSDCGSSRCVSNLCA
ncbi:unnamed protein product [Adineta ricciae]|uniref:Uncharacterized protein n=1 Tax=Adineta ricciae TaxID=249248 RepID=A0A814J0M2_ADIRI|nr:unnamed protein product [Adineta ricciae]